MNDPGVTSDALSSAIDDLETELEELGAKWEELTQKWSNFTSEGGGIMDLLPSMGINWEDLQQRFEEARSVVEEVLSQHTPVISQLTRALQWTEVRGSISNLVSIIESDYNANLTYWTSSSPAGKAYKDKRSRQKDATVAVGELAGFTAEFLLHVVDINMELVMTIYEKVVDIIAELVQGTTGVAIIVGAGEGAEAAGELFREIGNAVGWVLEYARSVFEESFSVDLELADNDAFQGGQWPFISGHRSQVE